MTMEIVAVVGVATAFMAATIGLVQNDIKRVLAYSTVSQLGFMFLAMGVGAFAAGAFHLMTHAFFKALLFLCSGSVIHAMAGQQDMRHMGGLKKYLPVTYVTMIVGTLAIAGIPPLSGFFSKDEILFRTFLSNKVHLGRRGRDGADDGVLHVPADVDDLLRRRTAGRRGKPTGRAHGRRPRRRRRATRARPPQRRTPQPPRAPSGDATARRPRRVARAARVAEVDDHAAADPGGRRDRRGLRRHPGRARRRQRHRALPGAEFRRPARSSAERATAPRRPRCAAERGRAEPPSRAATEVAGAPRKPRRDSPASTRGPRPGGEGAHMSWRGEMGLMVLLGASSGVIGILVAYRFYVRAPEIAENLARRWAGRAPRAVEQVLRRRVLRGDRRRRHDGERPRPVDRSTPRSWTAPSTGRGWLTIFSSWFSHLVDKYIVDGLVNLVGARAGGVELRVPALPDGPRPELRAGHAVRRLRVRERLPVRAVAGSRLRVTLTSGLKQ